MREKFVLQVLNVDYDRLHAVRVSYDRLHVWLHLLRVAFTEGKIVFVLQGMIVDLFALLWMKSWYNKSWSWS